ncbi:MAG: hypothetical protein IJA27_05685 [Lachnospiraceae bacterium]|nr:hypothetical protein [Lachnospiraceae bacterium]
MCEVLDAMERKGRKIGETQAFIKMVLKQRVTVEEASEELNISQEEFYLALHNFNLDKSKRVDYD